MRRTNPRRSAGSLGRTRPGTAPGEAHAATVLNVCDGRAAQSNRSDQMRHGAHQQWRVGIAAVEREIRPPRIIMQH